MLPESMQLLLFQMVRLEQTERKPDCYVRGASRQACMVLRPSEKADVAGADDRIRSSFCRDVRPQQHHASGGHAGGHAR